ncbi:Uncharacterised protein [uncultured archaeon]|nr:Uncharacterised protein [uncultured archaeon]
MALIISLMRGFDPGLGRLEAIIICILIVILISSAQAFPLHGGNGIVNATVYGIMKYEYGNGLYVDISASDVDVYEVELIDSDNNTYSGNSGPYRSTLHVFPTETENRGSIRDMLLFDVPKDIIVKRLRIAPSHSDPFCINWTGVTEVTGHNVTLRFYGATFEPNGMRWRQGNWNLDVNLTNSANQTAEYSSSDFVLADQFGWVYHGEEGDALKEIPARESLRFNVKVPFVSELSRPMAILFKGMNLDISAWA